MRPAARYFAKTGRRISYEYAMIDGVNDTPRHAALLGDRLEGTVAHVNLIPLNYVEESSLKPSPLWPPFRGSWKSGVFPPPSAGGWAAISTPPAGQLRRKALQNRVE